MSGHADRPSGQGASPPSRTGESESARYVFRRGRADTWVFAFNSAPVTIGPNLKGFEYLARLISQPNREMSSIVLALAEQPADFVGEAERDKPDVILTKDQEEKLLDRRSQLEMQNVDRENPELERQIRIIDKYLNEAKSRRGKPGLVVEPRIKKAFKSVQNAITRALNALRKNGLGELADHLAPCSTPENYHFVYRQERPPMWDVGWSPRTDSK